MDHINFAFFGFMILFYEMVAERGVSCFFEACIGTPGTGTRRKPGKMENSHNVMVWF